MSDDQEKKQEAKGEEAVPTTEAPTVRVKRPAVDEYLAGVRAELADLPATEVAEILDDVEAHLADLAAELGDDADTAALTARLGSPSAYAAELRGAAGYPSKPTATQAAPASTLPARLALLGLIVSTVGMTLGTLAMAPAFVVLCALTVLLAVPLLTRDGPKVPSVVALPAVQSFLAARPKTGGTGRGLIDFVASLQPAWWLVRALVAAVLVFVLFGTRTEFAAVLLFLVAAPISVLLGYASRRDRRWLWVVVPLNGLAAAALCMITIFGLTMSSQGSASPTAYSQPGLWLDGTREIEDIRPVDAQGRPLSDVYLFDQNGQAIDVTSQQCYDDVSSYAPTAAPRPYPRGTSQYDPSTGRCRHVPPAPLVAAIPQPTATPSMSATAPTTAPPPASSVPPATTAVAPPTTG